MIQLSDIHKTYQIGPVTSNVLNGIDLEVNQGDLLSVMGPSGCGKSTLMNILGLLDRPTSGSFLLNGNPVNEMNDDEASLVRNQHIGFVFQAFHLLPRLTAIQNAGLPLLYRGLTDAEVKTRATAALELVGMLERADHRPNELSGGQQQRVAVARAIVGQPSVILADEPTGALDPDTGREIMSMFEKFCDEQDMTLVIVTHDPQVARRCRRTTRMEKGVLSEG